jgi:hypothetical protein
MKEQLLTGALCTLLSTAVCAPASVLVTSGTVPTPASTRQDAARVYKFRDGGIQFALPAGWDVKADKDSVKILPKSGSAQIAFVALPIPTNLDKDERASLFDSLSGKAGITDMKLDDYVDNETMSGMKVSVRSYEGKNNGRDVVGMFFLLNAEKLVFITLVAAKSRGDINKELEELINSIKKIE